MTQTNQALEEILDVLLDCKIFNRLQGDVLRGAAQYFGLSNVSAGDVIFQEGDKGTFMCVVQKGRVSVSKTDKDGNAVVLGAEKSGGIIGEMAVLDGQPRSASCVAEINCELLSLAKVDLDAMLKANPLIAAEILRAIAINLSNRMRFSAGRLVDHLPQG
jgi:CRP-like cAMP-binding protein